MTKPMPRRQAVTLCIVLVILLLSIAQSSRSAVAGPAITAVSTTLDDLANQICTEYDTTLDQLISPRRSRAISAV